MLKVLDVNNLNVQRAMLDARFSHIFCQSLNRLQRGLSAIAELLVHIHVHLLDIVSSDPQFRKTRND